MPTSGVGPSVPGKSTTWMTASAESASALTARAAAAAPWSGCHWAIRASTGLLLWSRPFTRARCPRGAAVVVLSTTNTHRRYIRFSGAAQEGLRRVSHSHVRFEGQGARHLDAAVKCGDPLAGYPARVDDQGAGDLHMRRAARPGTIKAQIEPAGQFVLGTLDLQAADGPPSSRDPGQHLGPEADLGERLRVQAARP